MNCPIADRTEGEGNKFRLRKEARSPEDNEYVSMGKLPTWGF